MNSRCLLTAAAWLSMTVAVFHILLGLSAELSEYFGSGPQIAHMLRDHDPMIYLLIIFMVAAFAICGLYAFSGAGQIRHLPFLRTVLIIAGLIYTLRGIALIPELLGALGVTAFPSSFPNLSSSAVALATGLCFLIGSLGLFRQPRAAQA